MGVSLRRSRSPFQIGVCLALCLLSISSTVFFGAIATSSARELGPVLGRFVYGGTAIAAGVVLVGVFTRSIPGILIERVGLISLAFWTFGSGVGVMANSGLRGAQFGGYMIAVTLMCLIRARQTGTEAKEISLLNAATDSLGKE